MNPRLTQLLGELGKQFGKTTRWRALCKERSSTTDEEKIELAEQVLQEWSTGTVAEFSSHQAKLAGVKSITVNEFLGKTSSESVMLDVFISWSGTLSQEVATCFREFLPELLPGAKPWMSTEDIPKGKGWFSSILSQIGKSPVCIICLTRLNVHSSWVFFEAGGLAFAMKDPSLCPYLVDVPVSDISSSPLGQMQCTRFEKQDTWRLVRDINKRLENPHDEQVLKGNFESKWNSFKRKLDRLIQAHQVPKESPPEDTEELSEKAKLILLSGSTSTDGIIWSHLDRGGYSVQIDAKALCETENPREEADWRAAIKELATREMIEDQNGTGEFFRLTKPGYDAATVLTSSQEAQNGQS
jgi:hypothetical protein